MQWLLNLGLVGLAAAQLDAIAPVTPPKGTQPTNLPALGMGTWYARGKNATDAIAQAIVDGYRLIDTSPMYGNQREVGQGVLNGIKRAGIRREDVWLTTKLWTNRLVLLNILIYPRSPGKDVNLYGLSHDDPTTGLKETLKQLGLDYVDLYLIHWPMGARNTFDHVPVSIVYHFK
jgi:diketogulonate reductase-like aldo/keto reductase